MKSLSHALAAMTQQLLVSCYSLVPLASHYAVIITLHTTAFYAKFTHAGPAKHYEYPKCTEQKLKTKVKITNLYGLFE